MLITKEVIQHWSASNVKLYTARGYTYTKKEACFVVKVDDLQKYSPLKVEVLCDYCQDDGKKNVIKKKWASYIKERKFVEKDACDSCRYKKYRDVLIHKQSKGLLTPSDKGYWTFKENRLLHLKNYIKKFGSIDNMSEHPEGKSLYSTILNFKENPWSLAVELGFLPHEISKYKPHGYYHDFQKLKQDIEVLVEKFDCFPTITLIQKELRTDYRTLEYHGGIYEIKRKMNIKNTELIDKRGFYNSSSYELLLANYLIENDIPYLREVSPFPEHNYRSDFTFIDENEEVYHLEIWGYPNNDDRNHIARHYNDVREIKEKLYRNHKINLISLEESIFSKKSYDQIQLSLYENLSQFLTLKFKQVDQDILMPNRSLSDNELLEAIMKYSDDPLFLPEVVLLRASVGGNSIYNEIHKRFGSMNKFAEKFGLKTKIKSNYYWCTEKVNAVFEHMINKYGYILNRSEINKEKEFDDIVKDISTIVASFNKYGGFNELKLRFFENNPNNILSSKKEQKWLKNISKNLTRRGNQLVTNEQQVRAIGLLNSLFSNASQSTS